MSSRIKRHLLTLVLFLFLLPNQAQADSGREFLLSCTYGILAGSLVGAASLAVEDEPGEKLHRVARGASLGLYSGILLGLYVVYVVPAQMDAAGEEELEESVEDVEDYGHLHRYYPPKLTIFPVIENQKVTGAAFNFNVIRF